MAHANKMHMQGADCTLHGEEVRGEEGGKGGKGREGRGGEGKGGCHSTISMCADIVEHDRHNLFLHTSLLPHYTPPLPYQSAAPLWSPSLHTHTGQCSR